MNILSQAGDSVEFCLELAGQSRRFGAVWLIAAVVNKSYKIVLALHLCL